jgi:hypothetical protein
MAPVTWTATVEKRLVPLTDALNSVELINTIQRISTPTFAAVIFQTISLGDGVYARNSHKRLICGRTCAVLGLKSEAPANLLGGGGLVQRVKMNAGYVMMQKVSASLCGVILDGLIGQFQSTNAKFVSDYNNVRTIVDTSAGHASPNQPTPTPTPQAPTGLKINP